MTREEAIKIIKSATVYTLGEMQALETLIPELRESEDERIRKWLVDYFTEIGENWIHREFTCKQIVAYLEKQKERGPLTKEEEYTLYRIIEYLEDETCPSEWISLLHDIYCLPYEKQKEQKDQKLAEWSEEDEAMRDNILRVLSCFIGDVECESTPYLSTSYLIYQREMDWLKSLRPSWKPSEEQMAALYTAARESPIIKENGNYLYDLYDDLKKL